VVAGTQHPLARRRRIEPAELADELWTLPPPESPPGVAIIEAFRARGLDYPRATVIAILPEVRMRFMATGRFLAIFPNSVLTASTTRPDHKVQPTAQAGCPVMTQGSPWIRFPLWPLSPPSGKRPKRTSGLR
jgi:DNA-binding transcriptional LysR family regulator